MTEEIKNQAPVPSPAKKEDRPAVPKDHIRESPPVPSPAKEDKTAVPKDNIRETLETVVFVVVLVLMLKSFVAEAYVIPTGSMATTLYGYQLQVTCPQCGWQSTNLTHLFCPYCLGGDDQKDREVQRLAEGSSRDRIIAPKFLNPVRKGDRISSPFYLGRLK